ncbi:MAG TPA: PrsW family glutamic-type intramembrane protease [Stellaceae bacterium]|nr:PrsW family glutamic-type intramembrane protease [Stellaceae bacterium]
MNAPQPDGTVSAADDITRSELLPFLISFGDLRRRAFLWPGVTTAIFAIALLILAGANEKAFLGLLATYLWLANIYLVYLWCGKKQPFPYVLLITALSFILDLILLRPIQLTERALPSLIAPGLVEELAKALPLGIVLLATCRLSHYRQRKYGLREPLDGILLAAASASGFAFLETMFLYVPKYGAAVGVPRLAVNILGHIAYAGAFGYFIGLAVLHRRNVKKAMLAIVMGYLIANLLHDLWDAISIYGKTFVLFGLVHEMLVAVSAFIVLATAILKAREISPEREFLWPFGNMPVYQAPEVGPVPVSPAMFGDFWLLIGSARTRLANGGNVTVRDIPSLKARSPDGTIAEVLRHPGDPRVLVLRNLSTTTWEAVLPDGTVRPVEPAGTVRLAGGIRLDFGTQAGAITMTAHDPEADPPPQGEREWC